MRNTNIKHLRTRRNKLMDGEKRLTKRGVDRIVCAFLKHIADYWSEYQKNLPHLRRTLMVYNEFTYGIRRLPDNSFDAIEFNPRDPLSEDLEAIFGDSYTDEIGSIIYDAWPLRKEFRPWEGYEEPIPDTPIALRRKFPDLFKTTKDAHKHMHEVPGTGYGDYKGKRMKLGPCGTPLIWFRGFTTVKEFSWQKSFLDSVRKHPRIKLGIQLMEEDYLKEKKRCERKERIRHEIQMLQERISKLWEKLSELEQRRG